MPNRVLIVDGDISFMNSIKAALLEQRPDMEVTIIGEDEIDQIAGQSYDIFLIDDEKPPTRDIVSQDQLNLGLNPDNPGTPLPAAEVVKKIPLIERVRKYLPDAQYALVSREENLPRLASRAVDATSREGALYYIVKPDKSQEYDSDIRRMVYSLLVSYSEKETVSEEKDRPEGDKANGDRNNGVNEGPNGRRTNGDSEYCDTRLIVEEMIDEGPQILREFKGLLKDHTPQRTSLVRSVEEQFDSVIRGAIGIEDFAGVDDLEAILGMTPDKSAELERAILCKIAIASFYDRGDVKKALEAISDARRRVEDEKDEAPIRFLKAQMLDVLSRVMVEESNRQYDIGLGNPTSYTVEILERVESNVTHFKLKKPIRPTRGKVAIVNIGDTEWYRREDSDENSVRNEVAIYRFYRRISRRMKGACNLMQIPDTLGVVKSHDGSGWVMYREYVKGAGASDELSKIERLLKTLNRSDPEQTDEIERQRALKSRIMANMVKQCAYVLASGPTGLAEDVTNPLVNYYLPRLEDRILNPFNRMFSKAGVPSISVEDRNLITNASMPVHTHLSRLENVFYKDSWYANSVLLRRGRGFRMCVHDFASVKRLPLAIDLATLLCYGGFVSQKTTRNDPFEHEMVKMFVTEYSDAVAEFNSIARLFETDRNRFMLDEIQEDIGSYPSENPENIKAFMNYASSLDFRNIANAFSEIRRAMREGEIQISSGYVNDLETLAKNLKQKREFKIPMQESPEYAEIMRDFAFDYYAALYHRSLLVAGTICSFVLSRLDSSYAAKRKLLLHEMVGTLQGAIRGAHNFYTAMMRQDEECGQQRRTVIKFVRSLQSRINDINKGKKL
ncbi:MAG: hypothetical protein KKD17_05115 [Nanoarchaeota archaeon]|nr:hypothetical protein [Nanoarchaeota archaeon]